MKTLDVALDTSILIPYFQNDPKTVVRMGDVHSICVPIFVVGEMMIGFFMTGTSGAARDNFESFLSRTKILDCTREVANKYGELVAELRKRGAMIPVNDIWIAACCIAHGKRLVTSDSHFRRVPSLEFEMW